ncbi:MAG: rubredoxin [Comamonadaceae bacterium PBBC2]|nr:MAG: rubredoxin [Comamonadaceae bacterium PBBC2]
MKKYRCAYCAHVYDEAQGDPDTGIPPGTPFEDLPEDWCCIECGAMKSDYHLIED